MTTPEDLAGLESNTNDARQARFGFGEGGVPWYLLLFYLSFLAFFVWYVLEYQLPDYLETGPVTPVTGSETPGR